MSWFDRIIPPKAKGAGAIDKRGVPEGLWDKCVGCSAVLYRAELDRNINVCPKCGHHHRVDSARRLAITFDPDSYELFAEKLKPVDSLKFKDSKRYRDRLVEAGKRSSASEALVVAQGTLKDQPVVIAVFEFNFMGGSMGSVVGERFVRAVDRCIEQGIPFICFSASGGARMQEALMSLMQMAKTSAALSELGERGIPYISVLTDPTMGGVSASLAMLGDIIIAEPGALIGFAGPRVIEQTVRETLPEGFQRAEFLLDHGAVDLICDRRTLRDRLASLLHTLGDNQGPMPAPTVTTVGNDPANSSDIPESA